MIDKWANTVQCMDCVEGMKRLPDDCVDLARLARIEPDIFGET